MKFDWKPVLLLVVMAVLGTLAFWYHGKAADEQYRADTAEHNLNLANDTINDMQTRQREVAALDAKYAKELADAHETIDQLERDVAAGRKRLRLNATCPENGTASATGVDDGSGPRLTADAELNYWRLRDGIATVAKQMNGLQQYIREQCLK